MNQTAYGQPRSDFPCPSMEQECAGCEQFQCIHSRPPSLVECLSEMRYTPQVWHFNHHLYVATWNLAARQGKYAPVPYFTADATPVLAWAAVMEQDECGRTLYLPSGVVMYE